jgi:kynureninase
MMRPAALYRSPNALAPHYSRFRVAERLLLTGHSHQAWPDAGFAGQVAAWDDAASLVDDKWERAFAQADRVRRGFARLLDDPHGVIALGTSTHDLVVRWLSALPLRARPRLVTTDGEFHTIRRQLGRLAEEGIDVVQVAALPAATAAERLRAALTDRTAAVLASAVLFETGHIVPGLGELLAACRGVGAELLVDAYHALNVVPFSLPAAALDAAYVVGGGYKYCQLGEGNAFLRLPPDCRLRPVITGWYSEFDALPDAGAAARTVRYGAGSARFAGATYDPTSHYRAAAVFEFFEAQGLTPELLREVSRHQVALLAAAFDRLDADPARIARDRAVRLDGVGGFLALRSPHAAALGRALRERGVATDWRGSLLRLGPAPYLSDAQLSTAMDAVRDALAAGAAGAAGM